MAMTATDVYLSASGSDVNGGSEPTLLGSGTGATVAGALLTKAGALFTSLGITNLSTRIYLSGGTVTAGWYTVVTVDSDTQITLDRNPTNSASDVVYKIGGPLLGTINLAVALVNGDKVHIKEGTYAPGLRWDLSSLSNIALLGYKTTKGDSLAKPIVSFLGAAVSGIKLGQGFYGASLALVSPLDLPLIEHSLTDAQIEFRKTTFSVEPTSVAGNFNLFNVTGSGVLNLDLCDFDGPALPLEVTMLKSTSVDLHLTLSGCSATCNTAGSRWTGFNVRKGAAIGSFVDGADLATVDSQGFVAGAADSFITSGCKAFNLKGYGFRYCKIKDCVSWGNGTNYSSCTDLGGNTEIGDYIISVSSASSSRVFRGDSPTLEFSVTDSLRNPVSLVGMTLTLGCRRDLGATVYLFTKADGLFDKTDAGEGIVSINLETTDLAETIENGILELQGTWAGRTRTLLQAYLSIDADVVHA
jgi:hypothetical protein